MADELNTANEEQVVFDDKQQAKVNELIQKAMGKAAKETKQELERTRTELTTLQSELTTAKEALSKAKTPAERKEAKDDISALNAQLEETKNVVATMKSEAERWQREALAKADEVTKARQETLNFRKASTLQAAISKVPFVNGEVVAKLVAENIAIDPENPNKLIVVREDGSPRLNAALENMSVDEFINDFAAKNKYLVRGDIVPGTGSSESNRHIAKGGKHEVKDIFGPKSNAKVANELAKADPAEYRRLKAVAREAGLIG